MLFVVSDKTYESVLTLVDDVFVLEHEVLDGFGLVDDFKTLFVVVYFYFFVLEIAYIWKFWPSKENNTLSHSSGSCSPSNSMHKRITPLRWIKLNNPVNIRNVNTSCRKISSKQYLMLL